MAASDVTISQDGAANVKLHPYLVTLVRWCVSCLWSTASVFLHRLVTAPLPPITASKPSPKLTPKPRQASTDHLHPEPKVECVVLHTPESPTLDVIFVHGLYGSLGNTWRQGDWRSKYKLDPTKVSLRSHGTKQCDCHTKQEQSYNNIHFTYETNLNETELNGTVSFKQINGCFDKILTDENSLITEKFYNNTLLNVNNYETQAKFVSELFKTDCNKTCDIDTFKCNIDENRKECNCKNKCECNINDICKLNECNCKVNEELHLNKCEIGCGCVCDDCYSSCWPRDWIKEDFPGARVISINYTSDPYLWRPLWVKGNKRLRLHERAEQMIGQLLELGVGKRPIIWVGHSKGGLFIKQIYCEAFEAYNKINENKTKNRIKINNYIKDQSSNSFINNYEDNHLKNNLDHRPYENGRSNDNDINCSCNNKESAIKNKNTAHENTKLDHNYNLNDIESGTSNENNNCLHINNDLKKEMDNNFNLVKYTEYKNTEICGCVNAGVLNKQVIHNIDYLDISIVNEENNRNIGNDSNDEEIDEYSLMSLNKEEDIQDLQTRSTLWEQSAGFMFYSVPHRGSPLADIKTPITSRSVELLEISKDCQLVLELQDRWLVATGSSHPAVRSLVETCRTLMSVLWLRIVSVDSADAGIGSLYGVSVDHREICKPSSRRCLLYTELTSLIQTALNQCQCRPNNS